MAKSKLYRAQMACYDRQRVYLLNEAVGVLKKFPQVKFNQTVELAIKLGIDTRQSDQALRGATSLPHGTGKTVRVVVAAEGDAATAAREAGADFVGMSDLVEKLNGGWLDFDVMIATPDAMREIRKLGRVLGPRGLMPNPKTGTVTDDTGSAVREAKGGRIEYRADKGGCVHVPVGKVSFTETALQENVQAIIHVINRARPAAAKGAYIISATLSATMSPGIRVDTREFTRS